MVSIFRILLLGLAVGAFAEEPPDQRSAEEIQKRAAAFKFEKGRVGGTLHDWIDRDMLSWNLALSTDTQTSSVLGGNVFQALFSRDPVTMNWLPCLAAEVPVRSQDEDGCVWVVKLREGVKWHDGAPFGADDVVFTFRDVIMNEALACPGRAALQMAVKQADGTEVRAGPKVEKVDDLTVRFTLPRRFALALQVLNGAYILPKHILEKRVADKTFASAWDISTPPSEVVGTGPFMLDKYVPAEVVILKRNPRYWEKDEAGDSLPYLEKWEFAILSSSDAQLQRFLDGKIDYYEGRTGDFELLLKAAAEGKCNVATLGPRAAWSYLSFNQNPRSRPDGTPYVAPHKSAWFRDVRFRRAVSHCIDRDRILREIYSGRATALWVPYTPKFTEFFTDDVAKYPFDIVKAVALLDEMGLKDTDGDGVRDDGKGHAAEFELATVANQPALDAFVATLRRDLQKVGIRLVPRPLAFNVLIQLISKDWEWEAILLSYTAGSEPLLGKTIWKTGEARRVWNPKADPAGAETRDWERRIDEIFDEAYTHWDEAARAFDRKKDVELAHEWQRICAENLPHIPLFTATTLYGFSCRLGNVRTTLNSLFDAERLFIKP